MRIRTTGRVGALLLLATVMLAAPAWASQVVEVRVGNHPTYTRVVFELDAPAGYKIERRIVDGVSEILVTIDAGSTPRSVTPKTYMVDRVAVQDGRERSVAHIRLKQHPSRVKEMILAKPPRLVFDLVFPETKLAEIRARKAATKAQQAKAAEVAKPVTPTAPTAATAAATATVEQAKAAEAAAKKAEQAKAAEAATKKAEQAKAAEAAAMKAQQAKAAQVAKQAKAREVARKVEEARVREAKRQAEQAKVREVARKAEEAEALEITRKVEDAKAREAARKAELAKQGQVENAEEREIARKVEEAKAREAAKQKSELAGVVQKTRPADVKIGDLPPIVAVTPDKATLVEQKPGTNPRLAAKSKSAEPRAERESESPGAGVNWALVGGSAAAALLLVILVVVWLRRRSIPDSIDAMALSEDAGAADGATTSAEDFSWGEESMDGARADSLSPDPNDLPAPTSASGPAITAGPGSYEEHKEENEMDSETPGLPMERTTSETATAVGGAAAGGDVGRLLSELDRRVAQLETRLDESVDARERLERQVAAQAEELRVQRAAIARTQRALRSLNRGEEEQATEPAIREPSS